MNIRNKKQINFRPGLLIWLFIVVCAVVFVLLITQISLRKSSYELKIGDVSSNDISAPRTITYASDILTEEARQDAENNVNNIYLPADPTISRNQVQSLRYTFQYINVVRNDAYATDVQKTADMNAISLTHFDETTVAQLLSLSNEDWAVLQDESLRILENVMQNSIREYQVVTETENVPAMINYYISQPVSALVTTLVSRFVTANSLYSEELTTQSKTEARNAVQPRERTFVINQTIIQKGQVVTPLIYEALNKMGLVVTHNNREKLISTVCMLIGLSAFYGIYIFTIPHKTIDKPAYWLTLAALFLLYFISGRVISPNHTIVPYMFPASALGLTVSSLFGNSPAIIFSTLISVLLPYDFSNAVCLSVCYLVGSFVGIIVLGKKKQIGNFLQAGLFSGLVCVPLGIAYQYITASSTPDLNGIVMIGAALLINGMLSAVLALISNYMISGWIGITTPIQLMELMRPDAHLLQYLLQNAPGTYQHSLQVANLAEKAAQDIGADSLLTRVGAMYHDVGKTKNASFFVENQVNGHLNLHNDMTAQESAATIIRHVSDGVELCHQYHLPESIADFVRQHHGTNRTRFQYAQAVKQMGEENVDIRDFTYAGPSPLTKETALVMLADTCEARARAEHPETEEQIAELVKSVFNLYTTAGQLDNTPLTLNDLSTARLSFEKVLKNIYHSRMQYPDEKPAAEMKGRRNNSSENATPPAFQLVEESK